MSEQLYVCDGAAKCKIASDCHCGEPHELMNWCAFCGRESDGGIASAKCVPVASLDGTATNSQPETERTTSDPDVVLARHFASQPGIPFAAQQVLMRLAEKVEGKR